MDTGIFSNHKHKIKQMKTNMRTSRRLSVLRMVILHRREKVAGPMFPLIEFVPESSPPRRPLFIITARVCCGRFRCWGCRLSGCSCRCWWSLWGIRWSFQSRRALVRVKTHWLQWKAQGPVIGKRVDAQGVTKDVVDFRVF